MNNSEWRSSNTESRKENDSDQTNIHSHLELNELSDILEEGSSPHNGLVNGEEIIIQNDKVSITLGNLATSSHSNTNISNFESSCIINAVT